MLKTIFLTIVVVGSALALTTVSMRAGDPPHSQAIVEIQTGALTLELIKPGQLIGVNPDTQCWQSECPLITIRSQFSAAAQSS